MPDYLKTNYDLDSPILIEVLDETPYWSAPFGLKLLDNIEYRKNIKVLDIGFGTGFPLTEIALRLGDSSKIYGIDPWEAATIRAQKKIEQFGLKNTELIHGFAENIPLPSDYLDLITSNNGLNNVENLERAVGECSRVLKTDGQFIQSVNLDTTMIEFYDVFEQVLSANNMEHELALMKDHIYKKRKPLNEFTDLLEQHNFEIRDIIHDQFQYRFVDGTTMLNHFFIKLAFMDSWKNILAEDKKKDIFIEIESKLNYQADKKGGVSLTIPFVIINCTK